MFSPKREQCRGVDAASADRYRISCRVLSLRRIRYLSMAACDQNTDRFIRKRVRAKGTRPTADIPVADRDQARADAFILQPRVLPGEILPAFSSPSRF